MPYEIVLATVAALLFLGAYRARRMGVTMKVTERFQVRDRQTGQLTTYGSLDEMPADTRTRIEQARAGAPGESRPLRITAPDAWGRTRTYDSVEEMPADVREIYERVMKELNIRACPRARASSRTFEPGGSAAGQPGTREGHLHTARDRRRIRRGGRRESRPWFAVAGSDSRSERPPHRARSTRRTRGSEWPPRPPDHTRSAGAPRPQPGLPSAVWPLWNSRYGTTCVTT